MKKPNWDKSGWEIHARVSLAKGSYNVSAMFVDKSGAAAKGMNEIKFEVK
jgi:hypothetical protein